MKLRAQHVALELGLPLKDFVKLAECTLGLHINNLNMMLSADHVARLRDAAKRPSQSATGQPQSSLR
jgi:hypothetical protein